MPYRTAPSEPSAVPAVEALSPTARAMMPPLPRPDDVVMPEQGANFEDRVLLLLAAVILADGVLTYPEYELGQSVVRRIFGERALHAGMQARFHHALLNPPSRPAELAASLAREAVAEQVSADQIKALLSGLEELCRRRPAADAVARRLREAIDIAFAEQRLERRRRRLAGESGLVERGLEQGARLGLQMGRAAVGGTRQLMQSMVDAARLMLPRHDETPVHDEMLTPPVAAFNAELADRADALARAAWTLEDAELQRELADFRRILADQPFRVTLVGEGKRGKSSLVNALLGEILSPVREAVPETAAVAEFFYAPQPRYAVRWLDEEQFAHLADYLAGEEENLLLRGKVEALRRTAAENRPRGLTTLTSRTDIPDYLAVDGRYAALTARVSIGLPVELLRPGMVLVDTPGLNATDSFQDYLAYEESLSADCLIFVMDARRPDSASELRLLRKLAASGRAVSIIGVLTGVDRLNEADGLEDAKARALGILGEACRGAEGLRVLGLAAVNARAAMLARTGGAGTADWDICSICCGRLWRRIRAKRNIGAGCWRAGRPCGPRLPGVAAKPCGVIAPLCRRPSFWSFSSAMPIDWRKPLWNISNRPGLWWPRRPMMWTSGAAVWNEPWINGKRGWYCGLWTPLTVMPTPWGRISRGKAPGRLLTKKRLRASPAGAWMIF